MFSTREWVGQAVGGRSGGGDVAQGRAGAPVGGDEVGVLALVAAGGPVVQGGAQPGAQRLRDDAGAQVDRRRPGRGGDAGEEGGGLLGVEAQESAAQARVLDDEAPRTRSIRSMEPASAVNAVRTSAMQSSRSPRDVEEPTRSSRRAARAASKARFAPRAASSLVPK